MANHGKWLRIVTICIAIAAFIGEQAFCQTAPPPIPAVADGDPVELILSCLRKGQEAVLSRSEPVQCAPFLAGADRVAVDPLEVDIGSVCSDPGDLRRLPGNVIKTIARQSNTVNPTGIRIFGAIFCDELDLIGLELPFSLVLDKSIFVGGIQGRSFRTHGDLSFEYSVVLNEAFLARVRVDGTIFGRYSAINKLRLLDSEVNGSTLFRHAVFLDLAAFDTVRLSGELSVRNGYFPYLLIQFSRVGGVLDLTESQARCAYKVRKSEIGDVVAVRSGFGTTEMSEAQQRRYDWTIAQGKDTERFHALLRGAQYLRQLKGPEKQSSSGDIYGACDRSTISFAPTSFLISDTHIKSSFCLRSFRWPEGDHRVNSYLTLDDVKVDTSASIDMEPADQTRSIRGIHKLEIMGLETGSLFLKFSRPQPYSLSLSGLKFEHVYASDVDCDYDPNFANPDSGKVVQSLANSPGANSHLPSVEEVMGWLNTNSLATTQPFAAFVDVFQKHGEDSAAKSLRIAKVDTELCLKAQRLSVSWICGRSAGISDGIASAAASGANAGSAPPSNNQQSLRPDGPLQWANEATSLVLGLFLRLIADNGYHPEKVGWFVALAILGFALYFWFWLGVIGIKPKNKPHILPIGFVFLFDRLLPAYQIREDHYKIDKFLKRLPRKHKVPPGHFQQMKYLIWKFDIVNAPPGERLGIERTLDVLKVIGLILAVFLVAAINAIVSH